MLLSLFSGCGGLDLGFERAGFRVGLAYDIRPDSISSWNRNRPGSLRAHVADLRSIRIAEMDSHYGGRFVPSGIIGGPPCQTFSRANRSASPSDPRSKLFRHFFSLALRFHRARGPVDFILMENVPDLEKFQGGRLLEREVKRLEDNGFAVFIFILDAASYSVPQHRRRLFLLAFPKSSYAVSRWSLPDSTASRRTVQDAIHGLPSPVFFARGIDKSQIPVHQNHWCMVPKSHKFFDGSLREGRTSTRSFKTLAWNKPSVTASYGHREVHVHPNGTRRLSVFEAMKIQGFPEDYVLEGTLSTQIDQVSEAVPPPLAEAVAVSIQSALQVSAQAIPPQIHLPIAASKGDGNRPLQARSVAFPSIGNAVVDSSSER